MRQNEINNAILHWSSIKPILHYPTNHKDHDKLVHVLDQILDIIGENEGHELVSLADTLGEIISSYEDKHFNIEVSGIDALKYFMERDNLTQKDLPEIGSQGVVSEMLKGKRKLNLRHIESLAKRFKVSPSTFMPKSEDTLHKFYKSFL
jgi:HTH-type transcriptional regulator/antitoxin HigA